MKTPTSVIELLQNLIRIPSVNPDGDPGTDQTGELACAEYVRDFLANMGADVELRDVFPHRPNVVGYFPSHTATKKILFAPHLDTVAIGGMTIDPFGGEVRDGKIWGRGASDTKGSMAAMLWALYKEREYLTSGDWEIWFAGLMSEETGQHGSQALAATDRFDFVIAGEPTNMKVVHTHKGNLRFIMRTHGKAVHSSEPQRGENAIYKMADAIAHLKSHTINELKSFADPLLGEPTLSVGLIHGGTKVNIVPDFCEISVDIRTIPAIGNIQWAEKFVEQLEKELPGLDVHITQCSPTLFTPIDHPMVKLLGELGSEPTTAPWFCDACMFSQQGMAAIAMGPGSIAQAHTADEFITVADLESGTMFFRNFLKELAG